MKLTNPRIDAAPMASYAGMTLVMDEYCYENERESMPDYACRCDGLEVSLLPRGQGAGIAQVGMTQ